ncbi:hypothetical protein Tco_0264275, partial [Tanacetum coccineum]
LLSEVALAKDAQFEEVRRKSIRDFHKNHPSGSGTGVKPGVPDVMEDESSESEAKSWENDEDDSNNDHDSRSEGSDQERDSGDDKAQSDSEKSRILNDIEDDEDEVKDKLVKTSSNNSDDEDETKITDKAGGDKDEEMHYTTSQLYDDVDVDTKVG